MELSTEIRGAGMGRIGAGSLLLAKPDAAYSWIGSEADGRGAQVLTRALGIRDLVIGVGITVAAGDTKAVRPWLLAGIASDAVDFAATLAGPSAPGRKLVAVIAGTSTLAGLSYLLRG
jgi:hypothetical protein